MLSISHLNDYNYLKVFIWRSNLKELHIQEAFAFSWSVIKQCKLLVLFPTFLISVYFNFGILRSYIVQWFFSDIMIGKFFDLGLPMMIGLLILVFLVVIAFFILTILLEIGRIRIGIKAFHGIEKPSWRDYLPALNVSGVGYFLIQLVYQFFLGISFLVFLIPGFFYVTAFCFVLCIYVDQHIGIPESFSISAKLTHGVRWQLIFYWFILFCFQSVKYILIFLIIGSVNYFYLFLAVIILDSFLNSFFVFTFIYLYKDMVKQTDGLFNYH